MRVEKVPHDVYQRAIRSHVVNPKLSSASLDRAVKPFHFRLPPTFRRDVPCLFSELESA